MGAFPLFLVIVSVAQVVAGAQVTMCCDVLSEGMQPQKGG